MILINGCECIVRHQRPEKVHIFETLGICFLNLLTTQMETVKREELAHEYLRVEKLELIRNTQ
jgi:hypothetical protein